MTLTSTRSCSSDSSVCTTLRILCLHDNDSSATDLKSALNVLGEKLYKNHSIDVVYVNAPLTTTTAVSNASLNEENKFVWWEEINVSKSSHTLGCKTSPSDNQPETYIALNNECNDNELGNDTSALSIYEDPNLGRHMDDNNMSMNKQYLGLDASLMLIRQIWSSNPFWGIFGFGKGAAIASLFITVLESEILSYQNTLDSDINSIPTSIPPIFPQVVIFVSGESLISIDEPLLLMKENTNGPFILHLVDDKVSPEQELLIRQFSNGSQIEHRQKRCRQNQYSSRRLFDDNDLNIIGRFICRRKRNLYSYYLDTSISRKNDQSIEHDDNEATTQQRQILALQTALHAAEQDAANCIAESIALQPPAALMAIIRPQTVAGWIGNRRPQPAGGGAPCPEEFLHKKDRRQQQQH